MITRRRSGILVPLFSVPSTRSWGVGEFQDLPMFARWSASAGQSFVQILPITEIPDAETSPYSALTAMALDPIYISLPTLDDFQALGGEASLPDEDRATLQQIRAASKVSHREIRRLKQRHLRRAYERFLTSEVPVESARARRFVAFVRDESAWLNDYALFQAIRAQRMQQPWWDWPEPLARRHPEAVQSARQELRGEIYFRMYMQWVAAEQWTDARRQSRPLRIFGDLPFMISADSPDVWTGQHEFRFDATVGVPPDAFSKNGQDWGLPPWRWEVMADNDYEWMRRRAHRSASLFDGFRLDHLVGLYRTYIRPIDQSVGPFFAPGDEHAQRVLGEKLVTIYMESGAEIVAEDLGTVPDFVRESLQRLGVPGFKVMRWERQWHWEGQPYIDPAAYAETSVATTGTHDTEPLALWWRTLSEHDRATVLQTPSVRRRLAGGMPPLDAMLRALLDSRSRLVIIPVQDVFGWPDRINTPAQVSDDNWTWRLPWPVDRLEEIPLARSRAEALAAWSREAERTPPESL
ncbi:MAG: 4-alpha-glucanotransferase [Acidobacteria bacterium]|nr:4-alpha-glucanotransferase [Acidobacteriota bacterium]